MSNLYEKLNKLDDTPLELTESVEMTEEDLEAMQQLLEDGEDVVYDSEYSSLIDELYVAATEELSEQYEDLFIEPSVRGHEGRIFASFTENGEQVSCDWDFEDECTEIENMIMYASSVSDLQKSIKDFIDSKLAEA